MRRGHGRTVFISDNVADRRSSALSRRYSEQTIRKLPSKENLVIVPVLRNCEERRIFLRFLTPDVHLSRMVVPFTSFKQGPELINEQGSQNPVHADMLDCHNSSYLQPTIFVQFDFQKEGSPIPKENPSVISDSPRTVTDYRSPSSNVLGESHRLSRNKSIRDSLNNSLPIAAPKESSWLNYGSDNIASNISADATSKVDKPAKLSSKKKRKKKRKQYKRSMNNKASIKPENQGEEVNCDASKSESSTSGDLVCSYASENNLSLVVPCPSLVVQETCSEVLEQLECNGNDCSGMLSSSVEETLDKSINVSRKPVSLPYDFTDAETDKILFQVVKSSSNQSCELSLSTSLQNNPEIDMTNDSLVDCGTEWSLANDGGFNPLADMMTFTSRNVSVEGECKDNSYQDNDLSSSCRVNCSDWEKDVADIDCCSERLFDSSQASSSDDFHPVIYTKRGRLARKLSGFSNGMHRLNNAHLHRGFETNNKHSIWQKVEKAGTSAVTRPRNNGKIVSRNADVSLNCLDPRVQQLNELKQSRRGKSFRFSSNELDSSQSYSSIVSSIVEANSGHISMDGSTYLEKLQKKPGLATTERENQCARHSSINNINIPSKTQVLRNENLDTAVKFTNISHQRTDRVNTLLRSTKNSQSTILPKETGPNNICSILQNTSSMSQDILADSSVIELKSDQRHANTHFDSTSQPSVDMSKDPCIYKRKEDIQCQRLDMETTHLETSRRDNNSGSLLQKCIPTGGQDVVITRSQMDDQPYSSVHNLVPRSLNSSFTDDLSSNPHSLVYLSTREIQCSSPSSSYADCSSPEEGELINKLDSQPCTSSEESSDFSSPSGCHFSLETKEQLFPGFETDLSKIIEAVDGSYKLLVAAEGVQLATGSPLAGFERLLHSASPLIETDCISMCNICSQSQIIGNSLCSHQVPNISLRRLWQWYEKPGSYGLEVKLDELYTSKRSRTGLSKFSAYFVPYLSAVQLFSRSRKSINHPNNDTEGDLMKTCDVCDTCKYSTSLASLPIFSKLLPQPCKKEDTRPTKLYSSSKNKEFSESMFREQLADELLFEYFDSDQPQKRRPLFDKIQELILNDSSSNCHLFGDPSKLGCLNLKELHPASWYAVAWYPIYRIPEGSFRAAFLTYHSFGHFVRRSTSNSTNGCINSVILPIVGLQSYNAQGEFWFEPTNLNSRAVQTDSSMPKSPSGNFKGRLQSLERTASVMSRATIRKGSLTCTNSHPDYEFFLSRKR
ncbi:uncharacterized protein LOC110095900 isoform X2 [Dendrobium catenatum]|uniref:uncharacterized protein LOC110095900 isoform X2 n=1 Tax=Dendrobium catenatum TaxID=906689 RepID=UPI0009F1E6E6|nr:uncharacterized protein LOC110095900 isoform X2 [Dendrobium catenatum]